MNKLYFILPVIIVLFISFTSREESPETHEKSPITVAKIKNIDMNMVMQQAEREDSRAWENRVCANHEAKEAIRETIKK